MLMDSVIGLEPPKRTTGLNRSRGAGARGGPRMTHTFRRRAPALQIPAFLMVQALELMGCKQNLSRLYDQELAMLTHAQMLPAHDTNGLSVYRARQERRYINTLVRYLRADNQMTGMEASDLLGYFTRRKMVDMGPSRDYLFGIYPRELR
jgi:hypothetical protein